MEIALTIIGVLIAIASLIIGYLQLKRTPKPGESTKSSNKTEVDQFPSLPPNSRTFSYIDRRDPSGRNFLNLIQQEIKKGRIVSIWGEGGIGKTTIAMEAAKALSSQYVGVFWIGAEKYENFDFSMVLNEIGIQLNREDILKQSQNVKISICRTLLATKKFIIILDNFEIIREKEKILSFLKETNADILITSREYTTSIANIELSRMSNEEASRFIESLQNDSYERYPLSKNEINSVIETAVGNPLLIQWIVSQINMSGNPKQVLEEVKQGKGEAARRIYNKSYNLLSENEQIVLLTLGLFRTTPSLESLVEICLLNEIDIISSTFNLRKLRLISRSEISNNLQFPRITSLTLTLTKAYLKEDRRGREIISRYISYYVKFSEKASEETSDNYELLSQEKDNITVAFEYAYKLKDWPTVLRLWNSVTLFLWTCGYWDDYLYCDYMSLEAAEESRDDEKIAIIHSEIGWAILERGGYQGALINFEESYKIFEVLENNNWMCIILAYQTIAYLRQNLLSDAEKCCLKGVEIAKGNNLSNRLGTFHNYMGAIYEKKKDFERAIKEYDLAIEIHTRNGDFRRLTAAILNKASLEFDQGNYDGARKLYKEGIVYAKHVGQKDVVAGFLYGLAELSKLDGNIENSLLLAEQAERIYYELKITESREKVIKFIEDLKSSEPDQMV